MGAPDDNRHRSRRRAGALAGLLALVTVWSVAPGQGLAQSAAPGPHWDKGACQACHQGASPVPGNMALREPDAEALCTACHGDGAEGGSCRHVSDVLPGDIAIPDSYRVALQDGRVACTTCHDMKVQCLAPSPSYRFMNAGFLRERASTETSEHCYSCHNDSGFEKLNPHDSSDEGACLLCHTGVPKQNAGGSWVAVDLNMRHDLNDTCRGCHKVRPHPGDAFSGVAPGWEHLAAPSDKVLAKMKLTETSTGVSLPLEPGTGKVHCATCHDPHPDGLKGYPVAATPGSEYRLRVDPMCQACHEK
ncbi:MAG: hypothetical protein OEW59_03890 [Gammaproteobacteria bacterium]|nr:hypothetical protein [Gammaproteobacteria bacterium]